MRFKWRLVIGAIIALCLLAGIMAGFDGALKTSLGAIIGYLFGQASN